MIFKDQIGRSISIPCPPKRIISAVPSQTELLFDLGLNEEVMAITKFCIHPNEWFRNKKRIGGTKNLNLDEIRALNPDLIIANQEENDETQIKALCKEFPVWISNIKTLDDALDMIINVGELTGRNEKSLELAQQIKKEFEFPILLKNTRTAYLIWNDPMMSMNDDTFIHNMIMRCGFENVFAHRKDSRYPEISEEELQHEQPEVLLLSSEPFPFNEKHITHFRKLLPQSKIILADGEMFSWYGSRLVQAPNYFRQLIGQVIS